jgi:hypothetical protein
VSSAQRAALCTFLVLVEQEKSAIENQSLGIFFGPIVIDVYGGMENKYEDTTQLVRN